MHKSKMKKTESILSAVRKFNKLVDKTPYSKAQICGPARDKDIVNERQKIAVFLRESGHSYPVIAHVMDRDHTSIIHLVQKRAKKGVDN